MENKLDSGSLKYKGGGGELKQHTHFTHRTHVHYSIGIIIIIRYDVTLRNAFNMLIQTDFNEGKDST